MTPYQIDKYRAETNKTAGMYNWRTKTCLSCKRTRSPAQFKDSEKCNTCRGIK